MAQAPHKPTDATREVVRALKSYGVGHDDIAKYLGVSKPTLMKYYQGDLDTAMLSNNKQVGDFLFTAASGSAWRSGDASFRDCLTAAIFWAKTRMRWRETDRPEEIEGEDEGICITVKDAKGNVKITRGGDA